VVGLPESVLEDRLRGLEHPGLTIGFRTDLPENQVKLRFAPDVPAAEREALLAEACTRIGPRAFGVDTGDLAVVIGEELAAAGETLAIAESCTAGKLSAWVGGVAGASRYFLEGAIVYSNASKARCCEVTEALLVDHGAVSEPVARQLAEGIRRRAGATWGIGITGIAGPSGGSADKPVGTVHIAIAGPDGTQHIQHTLVGTRARITTLATGVALHMLHQARGQRTSKA
jgi:nicotinamide-nucleotide amidase